MNGLNNELKKLNLKDKKNHKKNKKKQKDNKINMILDEKPKEELTEEDHIKEEIINIKDKIRELKNIFTLQKQKDLFEDKLENFILIEKLIDYSKIKQKLLECFPSEDIFDYLFNIWNKILFFYENKNNIDSKEKDDIKNEISEIEEKTEKKEELEEKKDKKTKRRTLSYYFNKLLMNLNFFIPKIIINKKDYSFKNKISETMLSNIQMIKLIDEGENFIYYFINIFNIKTNLQKIIEKEDKISFFNLIRNNLCIGLNLINILDLQEMFPIEKIFQIIIDNYFLISYRIYSLLSSAYIKDNKEKKFIIIDKLFKIIEDNKNIVNYQLVYEIINKDFRNDEKKNELILKFIDVLKINFNKKIRFNSLDNAIYYCKLIFENSDLFTKTEIEKARKYICENYFNDLKENDWKTNLNKLSLFEYNDLKNYLNFENLENFYFKLPLNNADIFVKILKFLPKEIPNILKEFQKEKDYDGGAKIIKKLNYPNQRIPDFFERERIYRFFNYKIAICKEENNPHILIEYCLISQKTLDVAIIQLLNKYKKYYFKDQFFLYVINEVYYGAFNKKLKFSNNIQREIEELYYGIKYVDNYTFEDHFGPVEKNCIQIDSKKTEVFFIDNPYFMEDILNNYFKNSKYIGIDTEWQQSFKVKEEIDISIIQLSTDDEKCCVILDMLKLKEEKKFYEIFTKYLTGKIFIGFSFGKNDMEILPEKLKTFFSFNNYCTIYDLVIIYNQKYLEKCQSLKIITEKIFGKSMCKYEQCSDWNIRPLSKCQIHYAALDALICIILYKKINDN